MAPGKSRRQRQNRQNRNPAAHPYAMPPMPPMPSMPPMPPYGYMPMQMPYHLPMQMPGNMPGNVPPNMFFQPYPGQGYYGHPGFPSNFVGIPAGNQVQLGAPLTAAAPAPAAFTSAGVMTAPASAAKADLPSASFAAATTAPAVAAMSAPAAAVIVTSTAAMTSAVVTTTASMTSAVVTTTASMAAADVETSSSMTSAAATAEMLLDDQGDADYGIDSDDSDLLVVEGSSANCGGMYLPNITKPEEKNSSLTESQASKGKGRQQGSLNKATLGRLAKEAMEWKSSSQDQPKAKQRPSKKQFMGAKQPVASRQLRNTAKPKKIDLSQQFSNSEDEDGDL